MSLPYSVRVILDHYPSLTPEDIGAQLRYSTFVSVPKRFLYFAVQKAGCTTMKELLRTVEGAPPVKFSFDAARETRRYMFVHARENVPLSSLIDLDDQTQKEVLESSDFFRFTFVRNPYTRLVSAWKDKVMLCEPVFQNVYLDVRHRLPEFHTKSLIAFGEFIDYIANQPDVQQWEAHWRRQVDHLFFPTMNFSLVGKIEQMAEGVQRFERHLGLSQPLAAEAKNVSRSMGATAYTPCLADKVYSLYEGDFKLLGYDRDSWPRGKQDSGEGSQKPVVSEARFNEEVVERNIMIGLLYQERDRLQTDLQKVPRLDSLSRAQMLFAVRKFAARMPSSMKARISRLWRRQAGSAAG